jgi:hypothetical protein
MTSASNILNIFALQNGWKEQSYKTTDGLSGFTKICGDSRNIRIMIRDFKLLLTGVNRQQHFS